MTEQQNASNPLLKPFSLPPFSAIKPEHIVPAMKSAIEESRQTIERVVAQGAPYTWENLCQPLAESDDRLSRIWSPVGHLNAVKNSRNCVKLTSSACRFCLNSAPGPGSMPVCIRPTAI